MTTERVRQPLTLPIGRCGYPKLNPTNPPLQGLEPNQRKRWSLDVFLDPENDAVKRLKATLQQAEEEFERIHGYEPAKSPKMKRVTEWANKTKTRKSDPSLVGKLQMTIGANAEKQDGGMHTPPGLVDVDKEPIPHTDIYPGCYVRVVAALDEYQVKSKTGSVITHGLSLTLKMVQFVKDGDRMGGDTTDYSKFLDEDMEDEDEAPAKPRRRAEVSDDDI